MKTEIGFNYGVLCDSLGKQANEQGYELQDSDKFEKIRKAINMCGFHVATESQVSAMIKKLHKQVMENLLPLS